MPEKLYNKKCRQCGAKIMTTSANQQFCSSCARQRKKISDNERWQFKRCHNHKDTCRLKEDMLGRRKGNAIVVDYDVEAGVSSVLRCRCRLCRKDFSVCYNVFLSGAITCCPSCYNKESNIYIQIKDDDFTESFISHESPVLKLKLNSLSVVARVNGALFLCNCICGRKFIAPIEDIISGKIADCGCLENSPIIQADRSSVLIDKTIENDKFRVLYATNKYASGETSNRALHKYYMCECVKCTSKFMLTRSSILTALSQNNFDDCGYCRLKTEQE